jgi:hypothetical protein
MKLELILVGLLMFKILQFDLIKKGYLTQSFSEGFFPSKVDQGPYYLIVFFKVLVNDV